MKILITFYDFNNLGGIVNSQEALYAGLTELGHKVKAVRLEWKEKVQPGTPGGRSRVVGEQGMRYDQELGWHWPVENRIPYKGGENLRRWKEFASKFDLIIWQIPVPTLQRGNFGNLDWLELYDVPVKQIVCVHDGNFHKQYPWLYAIRKHLTGAVGVHPCAYHSLKDIDIPRAMAFSPQKDIEKRLSNVEYSDRAAGFLSLQTFKAWKHVDDLVRAIAHMNKTEKKLIAGGGIHYYYMTSKTKLKEIYLANFKSDPDLRPKWKGKRIWDLALENGMEYLGYIHNERRDKIAATVRLLIDPSWAHSLAKQGDHFNRTIIDGLICGCIPVARNLGVATNTEGRGELFRAGENYVMIPWNATPKEFAEIVDEASHMPLKTYRRILEAGRDLLQHFDYRVTAQTIIDLAEGKSAGYYNSRVVGQYSSVLDRASKETLNSFFAGKKAVSRKEEFSVGSLI